MKNVPPVIDTHAHLDELPDAQMAIKEAQEGGVLAIVAVGQDMSSNQKTLNMADQYPGFVLPAIGYHPWRLNPDHDDENLDYIDANLEHCVALVKWAWITRPRQKRRSKRTPFSNSLP